MGNNVQSRQMRCMGCIPSSDIYMDNFELNIALDSHKPKGKITVLSTAYLNQEEINLFKAAAGRNVALIRMSLAQGVNINTLDEERTSILHVAAKSGSPQVVEELIQNNANLDITDMAGWTQNTKALHVAAFYNRSQICQQLLMSGADSTIRSREGLTAKDLVRDKRTLEIFCICPTQPAEEAELTPNQKRENPKEQYDSYFRNLKQRFSWYKWPPNSKPQEKRQQGSREIQIELLKVDIFTPK